MGWLCLQSLPFRRISATLLTGLLLQEVILDRFTVMLGEEDSLRNFETAVVSILLAGYLVGAYFAVLHSTRNTLDELKTIGKQQPA